MNHFHKYFDQIDAHIIIFKHNKIESIYQKLDFWIWKMFKWNIWIPGIVTLVIDW